MSNSQPLHKHMDSPTSRTRSFIDNKWPKGSAVVPNRLVDAGFFYEGKGDAVQCFHCGLELSRWSAFDIPHKNHARYSPQCEFIINNFTLHPEDFNYGQFSSRDDHDDFLDYQDRLRALGALQHYDERAKDREGDLVMSERGLDAEFRRLAERRIRALARIVDFNGSILDSECKHLVKSQQTTTANACEEREGDNSLDQQARVEHAATVRLLAAEVQKDVMELSQAIRELEGLARVSK